MKERIKFSAIIFILILLKVGISQQNLNKSSTIVTRKLMHKNGLKEFTVQKNIKGNECGCACYCSLPNSPNAMAQMRLISPNLDSTKLASPNSTRRFEIEKIISGNQCKCSCICAEPDNTIDDEYYSNSPPQIEPKQNIIEENGKTKSDNKNDINLVEEKKSNLEEFTKTLTSASSSSAKEIEQILITNSFESTSNKITRENNKKLTTNSFDRISSSLKKESQLNLTTSANENNSNISSSSTLEMLSSRKNLFAPLTSNLAAENFENSAENSSSSSTDLIEQNPTTNSFELSKSGLSMKNEPISSLSNSTNIAEPNTHSTFFERNSSSSAADNEANISPISLERGISNSAMKTERILATTFDEYGTSPKTKDSNKPNSASTQFVRSPSGSTRENWHSNHSVSHEIDSNESDEEKAVEGIKALTGKVEEKTIREEVKGKSSNDSDQIENAMTTIQAFRKVENSESTFSESFGNIPSTSSFEITQNGLNNYKGVENMPNEQKTTQNAPNEEKALKVGNQHYEFSSKSATTSIGWIQSNNIPFNNFEATTLFQKNQEKFDEKITTAENPKEYSVKMNENYQEKIDRKEERRKEKNAENTTESSLISSTGRSMNPITMPEEKTDEENSTYDPLFKARVAQLLNKLKVKLFRFREMEQEKNMSRNGTENWKQNNRTAEKDEKRENGEERQIFFQIDPNVEQKIGGNQIESEINGTSLNEGNGLSELSENKIKGQNEKNIPLNVPEGRTTQIFIGTLQTTLASQFSAFVTSDGTENIEKEENKLKTTLMPKGVNGMENSLNGTNEEANILNIKNGTNNEEANEINDLNEGKNASQSPNEETNFTRSIKEAKNPSMNTFTSSTPHSSPYMTSTTPSPHQLLEEATTLNPVFKARVANLLNRLKEQLYRLRAAQQQNSTLNGTNSERKHSIEANPLANLLNASSNSSVPSSNGMLSKSEQMLEGLQRKLEQVEKRVEKTKNSSNVELEKSVGNHNISVTMKTKNISINKGTTTETPTNIGTTSSSGTDTETSKNIKTSINTRTTSSSNSDIETSTNVIKMNRNNLTESTVKIDVNNLASNSNLSSEEMSTKNSLVTIQTEHKSLTKAAPNDKKETTNVSSSKVKTDNWPSNSSATISIITPTSSSGSSKEIPFEKVIKEPKNTEKLNEKTTVPISIGSTLTSPIPSQNTTAKILLAPIIGQSKNLAESSISSGTTENSLENEEEEEDNFAFVTEEPEVPKTNLPSTNVKNSSKLEEKRPIIVFVLNETASINNGRGGNDANNNVNRFGNSSKSNGEPNKDISSNLNEKNADKLEELPKNVSNNEGHLFPFTNDFLIDLPPKMVEKGKQQEGMNKSGEKGKEANEEDNDKRVRVILLPAPKRGRIHDKITPLPAEDAPKIDEDQNWPSLITIKEKEDKNNKKMTKNAKSIGQNNEAKEMEKSTTKISNNVEINDEGNGVDNLPRNSPKSPLKSPKLTSITKTTTMPAETMGNLKVSNENFNTKREQQNWTTTTQKTIKQPRRKFVAPQAQNLIERLEQARKLREEQVKLEMMEAIRQEQIGFSEPDPQLAERRREIEQRLLQLAQAERLHREMLEEETVAAQRRYNVDENGGEGKKEYNDAHSSTQQANTPSLDCSPIRQFIRLFHISNAREWIEQNCKFARRHFPNASCPQIGALLSQCLQEVQQNDGKE